jgi:hypothetical protein
LHKEREEAKQLITRQNHAYGDSYGGSPNPLVETCQRDVRASDHYILILGERYGTRMTERGGKSVTELEFEAAEEAGLSIHVFFLGYVSDLCQHQAAQSEFPFACRYAVAALPTLRRLPPISLDDLQAVIDSPDFFQDGSPYFKGIWMQAADPPLGQQAILQAIAQESKDLQQLAAETGLSEDTAKEALRTLVAHDVIESVGSNRSQSGKALTSPITCVTTGMLSSWLGKPVRSRLAFTPIRIAGKPCMSRVVPSITTPGRFINASWCAARTTSTWVVSGATSWVDILTPRTLGSGGKKFALFMVVDDAVEGNVTDGRAVPEGC